MQGRQAEGPGTVRFEFIEVDGQHTNIVPNPAQKRTGRTGSPAPPANVR
ncbi:MAG: hypothetical protein FD147_2583 [Chloroflexi bacterium]|nr:MAG: hypothetical protein FD147_2583 [Chloroflexota bacterium]